MSKKTVIPAEVFSRVSGYFRPVNQWNNGKREEFSLRKYMDITRIQADGASETGACRKGLTASGMLH